MSHFPIYINQKAETSNTYTPCFIEASASQQTQRVEAYHVKDGHYEY